MKKFNPSELAQVRQRVEELMAKPIDENVEPELLACELSSLYWAGSFYNALMRSVHMAWRGRITVDERPVISGVFVCSKYLHLDVLIAEGSLVRQLFNETNTEPATDPTKAIRAILPDCHIFGQYFENNGKTYRAVYTFRVSGFKEPPILLISTTSCKKELL